MKLVWSAETASKAFIDTVKTCKLSRASSVAELISAMAAGWNAKLIVETWARGGAMNTSIGLEIASHHSGGSHVCIVPDEASKLDYLWAMKKETGRSPQILVGEPKDFMGRLEGIDFMVVDSKLCGYANIFRVAKLGQEGAVLICKNAISRADPDFRWQSVLDENSRIVKHAFLPVGNGLDTVHVGATDSAPKKGASRWIKFVDRRSGEETFIRI